MVAEMSRTLLCFAHGRPGSWEAICLDFDLAVQGQSFEDVKRDLGIAIDMYVKGALQEEPAVAEQLLGRSAPFSVKIKHIVGFLISALRHRKNDGDSAAGFSMPCRA